MTPEEVGRILDEVGKRVGPAGEYAWGLAVRWQVTAGAAGLLIAIVIIALVAGATFVIWKKSEDYDSVDRPMVRGISTALAFLVTCGLLVVVVDSALRLLNPEYAALRDLIGGIR